MSTVETLHVSQQTVEDETNESHQEDIWVAESGWEGVSLSRRNLIEALNRRAVARITSPIYGGARSGGAVRRTP
jgi:hypothetical protein